MRSTFFVDLDLKKITPNLMGEEDHDEGTGVATIKKVKVQKPRLYKVLLHNDDYTTMEFVVYVLQKHFGKSMAEAQGIMLKVHTEGVGICGVFTYEVAESKVAKVTREAKQDGHPLKCSTEPE
ncbi:MAG: ATP-dependent Clp protease adapter ClpS [Bacteriovoracaceae bacterium]|nr:ATP-dependent Clp protease adapter ClpS [Bacteriovoracaceae bacterium]